jgi:multiple sugar transport system permease protein
VANSAASVGVPPRHGARIAAEAWIGRNVQWVFPAPAVLAMGVLMAFPLAYTAYLSCQEWYASSVTPPEFVGLRNYLTLLLSDERFWPALMRTLSLALGSVALSLIVGLGAAHLLIRSFPGRGIARTIMLLPMIAAPVAMALIWGTIMSPTIGILNFGLRGLGLPGSAWVASPTAVIPSLILVDTWMSVPMVALICLAGLSSLPPEPFEAARVDGANAWRAFWHITLPLMRSTIVVTVIFRLIDALKIFDIVYVMTEGGPGFSSETLNLYVFQTSFKYLHLGYASALIVIFFALVLSATLLLLPMRRVQW